MRYPKLKRCFHQKHKREITFRFRAVFDALGLVLMIFSLWFILPIIVAIIYSEDTFTTINSYFIPLVLSANTGLIMWLAGRKSMRDTITFKWISPVNNIQKEDIKHTPTSHHQWLFFNKNIPPLLVIWIIFVIIPCILLFLFRDLFYIVCVSVVLAIISSVILIQKYTRRFTELGLREREAYASVSIGWLVVAFFGAIPYVFNINMGMIDAFFESMSGFATCGSTVLDVPHGMDYTDVYTHSILFWRALTQWIGGMGIIVLSVAILGKHIGTRSAKLFQAEASGYEITRIAPRIKQTAFLIWKVYILLTVVEILFLFLSGLSLFDAICHAFTSLATGGFSTHARNVMYYNNPYTELILIIFMIIGGASFVLHYNFITGKPHNLLKNSEFRFYIGSIAFSTFLITLILLTMNYSGNALRDALFQVVSIHTASGFNNTDFSLWPWNAKLILFLLMFIGGCVGSTAGGIKCIRILVLFKSAKREILKVIRPRTVSPVTVGKKVISEDIIRNTFVFFFLYMVLFVISTIVLSATGLDMVTSSSAVATTIGTVGPGFGGVSPVSTFSFISPLGKMWLALCMWFGRLEIFACLILFSPKTYKS